MDGGDDDHDVFLWEEWQCWVICHDVGIFNGFYNNDDEFDSDDDDSDDDEHHFWYDDCDFMEMQMC